MVFLDRNFLDVVLSPKIRKSAGPPTTNPVSLRDVPNPIAALALLDTHC